MRCEIRIAGGGSYFGHVVTMTPPITVDMGYWLQGQQH